MHAVLAQAPAEAPRVLALTDADLFIPALTFVFGRAQLGGRLALVSLARLRAEFHGAPPDPALLAARARKETLHELGHLLGLAHCDRSACAMAFSVNVAGIDAKPERLCPRCAAAARQAVAAASSESPQAAPRRPSPTLLRGLPWRS
jgi:archaemetzincin